MDLLLEVTLKRSQNNPKLSNLLKHVAERITEI